MMDKNYNQFEQQTNKLSKNFFTTFTTYYEYFMAIVT